MAAPIATGRKNMTFFINLCFRLAKNLIRGSYIPKITAKTPPESPGSIKPTPTRAPFKSRMNQSAIGLICFTSGVSIDLSSGASSLFCSIIIIFYFDSVKVLSEKCVYYIYHL
jgi:hypothetical protein